jgi:hypothetical protein
MGGLWPVRLVSRRRLRAAEEHRADPLEVDRRPAVADEPRDVFQRDAGVGLVLPDRSVVGEETGCGDECSVE